MNIGVVGGGSVGLLISSYLSTSHHVRVYVRRKEQEKLLNSQGILEKQSGEIFPVEALLSDNMEEEDFLIICVKQHHIESVFPILNRTNSQTPLLFLQNGMGHISLLDHFSQPIYLGVNNHGTLREKDYVFSHTGKGEIILAHFNSSDKDVTRLKNQLNNVLFPVSVESDWSKLLKEKLIVNAVINPLTALFKIPNGEILSNTYLYDIAEKLCYEAARTLDLEFEINWRRVKMIVKNTSENTSSMLKDLIENRPTENEAISGYIIKISKTDLPYTSFVYKAIKAMEVANSDNDNTCIQNKY